MKRLKGKFDSDVNMRLSEKAAETYNLRFIDGETRQGPTRLVIGGSWIQKDKLNAKGKEIVEQLKQLTDDNDKPYAQDGDEHDKAKYDGKVRIRLPVEVVTYKVDGPGDTRANRDLARNVQSTIREFIDARYVGEAESTESESAGSADVPALD